MIYQGDEGDAIKVSRLSRV